MPFTYQYPRPAVTVDCIVFKKHSGLVQVLLIKRKHFPFEGCWALPGGFVDMDERLIESAYRELQEETAISEINLAQFATYGDPGRDPRGRTVSIVYSGEVNAKTEACAGDDAAEADWFETSQLPDLAFDHKQILNDWKKANCL